MTFLRRHNPPIRHGSSMLLALVAICVAEAATSPCAAANGPQEAPRGSPEIMPQVGHALGITNLAIRPDGEQLVTGSADGRAIICDPHWR